MIDVGHKGWEVVKIEKYSQIRKEDEDGVNLLDDPSFYLTEDGFSVEESDVVAKSRIGIGNYAEEWTHKPLRFYLKNNSFVSKK